MPDQKQNPKRRFPRTVVRWIILGLIAFGTVVFMLAFLQRRLMYFPTKEADLSPALFGLGDNVESIETQTSDGLIIHGWHWQLRSQESNTPVVLFLHGNGGNRRHRIEECRMNERLGCETVIFDYRGYGENKGSPSEAGLNKDAHAAWDYAVNKLNIAPDRIVVVGGSLGGGVACRLVAELCDGGTTPRGLILRSTFSSMVDAASFHYPWLPVKLVLKDRYPSTDVADRIACPVLQFHGTTDRVVPFEMGQRLFAALPERSRGVEKHFVELTGVGHNGVLIEAGERVSREVAEFLQRTATL